MTFPLARPEREKLAKLLTLGSADTFAGERVAAIDAAGRLIKARGLSWESLLLGDDTSDVEVCEARYSAPPARTQRSDDMNLNLAKRHVAHLTRWEFDFIHSVGCRHSLTEKQRAVVDRIAASLRKRGFE